MTLKFCPPAISILHGEHIWWQTLNGLLTYAGFQLCGGQVQMDDTLLLIEPGEAQRIASLKVPATPAPPEPDGLPGGQQPPTTRLPSPAGPTVTTGGQTPVPQGMASQYHTFFGATEVKASTARMRLIELSEEIIALLAQDPQGEVKVMLNIEAHFPEGAPDQIRRAVSENSRTLGFSQADWE